MQAAIQAATALASRWQNLDKTSPVSLKCYNHQQLPLPYFHKSVCKINTTVATMSDTSENGEPSTTTKVVFVTASNADYRTINRFLLDAIFIEAEPDYHQLHVVMHKDANLLSEEPEVTKPGSEGLDGNAFDNVWAGASVEEVEAFHLQIPEALINSFLILDDKGVEDQTVIVAERASKLDEEEEFHLTDKFNKTRVAWCEAISMIANLEISNMGFEEFVVEVDDEEEQVGGWYEYNTEVLPYNKDEWENKRKVMEPEFKKLEEEELV